MESMKKYLVLIVVIVVTVGALNRVSVGRKALGTDMVPATA